MEMEPFAFPPASKLHVPRMFDGKQEVSSISLSDSFVQLNPILSGLLETTITRVSSSSPTNLTVNSSFQTPTPTPQTNQLITCVVCGDRATGRHYNAISCEGCKGFFKRSIRRQMGYVCLNSRKCVVTKDTRNRCQYCRMQKCLKMGMRLENVQYDRKPINPSYTKSNKSDFANLVMAPFPCTSEVNVKQTIKLEGTGTKPERSLVKPCNNIEKEKKIIPASCVNFTLALPDIPIGDNLLHIHEMAARLLFLSIKWIHSLPPFHSLRLEIQIYVVKCAWKDIFCLGLAQCQNLFPLNHLSDGLRAHLQSKTNNDAQQMSTFLAKLSAIFKEAHDMNIDDFEFAAMKVLSIFSPDRFADWGTSIVSSIFKIQSQILKELKHHIIIKSRVRVVKGEDKINATSRVGQLLLLLYQIRGLNVSIVKEVLFTNFWANSFDDLVSFTLTNCNENDFANLGADHDGLKTQK